MFPATSEHFCDGDQEEGVDELNEEQEEVVVDELSGSEVILFCHVVLAEETSQLPHVWVVRCDSCSCGVDDCSDDVDQKRSSLGVQRKFQELLQILTGRLL